MSQFQQHFDFDFKISKRKIMKMCKCIIHLNVPEVKVHWNFPFFLCRIWSRLPVETSVMKSSLFYSDFSVCCCQGPRQEINWQGRLVFTTNWIVIDIYNEVWHQVQSTCIITYMYICVSFQSSSSFVSNATAAALISSGAIPFCLTILKNLLPFWKQYSVTEVRSGYILSSVNF